MDINLKDVYIDNIHRLPTSGKGPIPIIVRFISKLDRSNVWERKELLGQKGSNIFIREHFNTNTEKNIRTLLPVRRQAIIQKRKVCLNEDRLTIDGKVYNVNNLNQLTLDLHPRQLATNEIDNHLFFFSEASPLSNYHPSTFTTDRESFSCGEEFIQTQKAKFFKDQQIYTKIKAASTPWGDEISG